jgi:sirohydrochlorin cobaltochelatase
MAQDTLADATLVLLGHGTTQNEDSAAPVYQQARELRRRNIFADVREAFWKQAPQVKAVLAGISAPRVFIVPMFISEGYFSEEIIPRELGLSLSADPASRITHRASRAEYYCQPVGTHDSMTSVLLGRAGEVVEQFPFPRAPKPKDITLFIAGHGTARSEKSRETIERQVELLRAINLYAGVHAIFLEETPRIADCYPLAQTKNIVIVPFFISDGLHTREDIPVLLGEPKPIVQQRVQSGQPTWRNPTEKNGKLVWYSSAVGSEPHIADVILERVREASPKY